MKIPLHDKRDLHEVLKNMIYKVKLFNGDYVCNYISNQHDTNNFNMKLTVKDSYKHKWLGLGR